MSWSVFRADKYFLVLSTYCVFVLLGGAAAEGAAQGVDGLAVLVEGLVRRREAGRGCGEVERRRRLEAVGADLAVVGVVGALLDGAGQLERAAATPLVEVARVVPRVRHFVF